MAEIHSFKEYIKDKYENELFEKMNDYDGSKKDPGLPEVAHAGSKNGVEEAGKEDTHHG